MPRAKPNRNTRLTCSIASTPGGVNWAKRGAAALFLESCALPVLKVGLPLVDEGGHALFLILGGEQGVELAALEAGALGKRRGEAPVDRLLDHHHRVLRQVGDLVGDLHGLLEQLVDGDDAAYEVGALRLLSLHHPPRETELHGLRLADRARQALSTARPRHDAEIDLRLAEHGVVAVFGQPEINLGIMPGAGGTQRLTRAVGKAKAMELCLTGRMMKAEEAERANLVSRVIPAEELLEEAMKVADKIANLSQHAVMMIKEAINRGLSLIHI